MSPEAGEPGAAHWVETSARARLAGGAVAIGALSGLAVHLFQGAVEAARHGAARLGAASGAPAWAATLAIAVGAALVVALLRLALLPPERFHGVTGVIVAGAIMRGRLPWWRLPARVAGAIASIAGGASLGPEDPSVQIGANVAALGGDVLRLRPDRRRVLLAAGAAAGISAAFQAPIAGILFAAEVILGEIAAAGLGTVVLAAVAASATSHALGLREMLFRIPHYEWTSLLELPFHAGIGLLAGPVAALYVKLFDAWPRVFAPIERLPLLRLPLAGLAMGLAGLALPEVLGVGYGTVGALLDGGGPALALLLALVAAKLVLTPMCIAAGFLGGVFAPALFIGAGLGAAFCGLVRAAWPALPLQSGSCAMVGMAALLAAATHAPLTAVLLLVELTGDWGVLVPLLLGVTSAQVVKRLLARESVYTASLARRGIQLGARRPMERLELVRVAEVMERGAASGASAAPDDSVAEAAARMAELDVDRLAVVARDAPEAPLGVLTRAGVLRAMRIGAARRTAARQRLAGARLRELSELGVHEFVVAGGAPADGRHVRDVPWPAECVVASLQRHGRAFVAKGATQMRAGDRVTIVAVNASVAELERIVGPEAR